MKLHLGCGQIYLDGYINIDYPLDHHSVQTKSVADKLADITKLKYKKRSISEIRLHHVFEHFSRPCSLALLASWNSWLKIDGDLCIEVPDFEKSARKYLSIFSSKKSKFVALRHIFGSQEAHWAVHFEGYNKSLFNSILPLFGYKVVEYSYNSWKGTYNIVVKAKKIRNLDKKEAIESAEKHLKLYLVSETESELVLLNKWVVDFVEQLEKTSSIN